MKIAVTLALTGLLMVHAIAQPAPPLVDPTITILTDDITVTPALKTDVGFSCLVQAGGRSILFDTGSDGPTLLANADSLHRNLSAISAVIISHPHTDHTGGLSYLLTSRVAGIPVYVGRKYFTAFSKLLSSWKCQAIAVADTHEIMPGVYSSGELPGSAYEQSLVLNTRKGLVLITGCAHPGIATIIARVQEKFRKEVYFVIGGFHLLDEEEGAVQETVRQLRALKVKKWAPTHCTGSIAIAAFRQQFGPEFIPVGAGSVIQP